MIWSLVQIIYLLGGAMSARQIIAALFSRAKAWGDLAAPVPAFVIVVGVLALWPILLLLITETKNDR